LGCRRFGRRRPRSQMHWKWCEIKGKCGFLKYGMSKQSRTSFFLEGREGEALEATGLCKKPFNHSQDLGEASLTRLNCCDRNLDKFVLPQNWSWFPCTKQSDGPHFLQYELFEGCIYIHGTQSSHFSGEFVFVWTIVPQRVSLSGRERERGSCGSGDSPKNSFPKYVWLIPPISM